MEKGDKMWFDILKSFDVQLKQKIKELDMNKVFDIEFVDKNVMPSLTAPYKEERRYKFNVSLDVSEYVYLDQSGTKRELEAGDKHGPYTMFIDILFYKEIPKRMHAELYLEVIKPEFKTTRVNSLLTTPPPKEETADNLESFSKKIDEMLMDYYVYLRETHYFNA